MGINVNLTKGATKAELDTLYAQTLTAKTAAELAETNAETAETNAGNSSTNAANSATASATSATASAASASAAAASEAGVDADRVAAAASAAAALVSENNAQSSENDAETAQTAAETAKTAAELAETHAETAETNAETAETAAVVAQTAATASQTSATASQTSATASATSATASAASAASSASGASSSATDAQSSEDDAATSETNAATSATSASGSATTATTQATNAATSATTATTQATNASTSATTSTTQAGISTTKAGEAATSASNAATSETNASTSETNAGTSATNASTSETNASASETNASNSATTATTKASEASTSEVNAGNSAASAATSASSATTSASTATTQASNASTSASNASTSAANAATSATNAATSATASATSATASAASASAASATLNGVLAAYNNTTAITGNAVDVFIYDTSNDSDGGAWRKRTQATSWYNETLNTATRGSRKEFPSVAVIVVEASKVTIYDGDTPDLDMWMVFNAVAGVVPQFWRAGRFATSIAALNGILSIGIGTDGGAGLALSFFVADKIGRYSDGGTNDGELSGVLNRNSTLLSLDTSYSAIVNSAVNDVAMTVLPNAPIDSTTGLPIPTIAVATDGGVSVIKDDGNVWDITNSNATYTSAHGVHINSDGALFFSQGSSSDQWAYGFNELPSADNVMTINTSTGSTKDADYYYYFRTANGDLHPIGAGNNTLYDKVDALSEDTLGTGAGLSVFKKNLTTPAKGSVAYLTSNYNSGYMTGDIKGAWLADTDTTNVVGTGELVTNGTFDTDTTGWTLGTDWGYDSANQRVYRIGTTYHNLRLASYSSFVIGVTYVITFEKGGTGPIGMYVAPGTIVGVTTGNNTHTFTITNSGYPFFFSSSANAWLDNVSVKLADSDRSVNNKGLVVNGTITKTAVATGAELVGYSGFSSSNYLEQPYNADLDFGTGDFSIMGWVKIPTTVTSQILNRIDVSLTGGIIDVRTEADGGLRFLIGNSGYTALTYDQCDSGTNISDNTWHFAAFTRTASSLSYYDNGTINTVSASTPRNVSSTSAITSVGIRADKNTGTVFNGSLALWRISATAPTAAQIKEIYEAEKPLFQENAKCTLNGASDAVQCLAYDDSTELLHVGTSAGRSTFQGLRRVDETSTNTTEISAQGGMIIEETA